MSYGQPVLEVVFHSATDLPKPLFSMKEAKPYVMADIISPDTKPNWVKTITDENGGENPVWDYAFQFHLNPQKLHMARNFNLVGKIMHSGKALGHREIGHFKVRVKILLDAGERISYPVVSGGKEKGQIIISHKLLRNIIATPPPIGVEDPNPEFLNTTSVPHSQNSILELIFHSATGLPHPLFNNKGSPYVLATIFSVHTKPNWIKTVTHESGGENPVWDYVIEFPMTQEMVGTETNFSLFCKIMHFGNILGDREIGHVIVPLQNFLRNATGERISYPVESGGVKKGEIFISHRLVTNTAGMGMDASTPQRVIGVPNRGALQMVVQGLKFVGKVTTYAATLYDVVADGFT